ncbi:MAG TPA: TIGR03435 family protein [Vicinamibacterales bacterium]|nr:TIGR03435 family protein [Vicinamibacterales bacterium]
MRKLGLTLLLAGCVAVVAQEKDATFEVASVKANKSGDGNGNMRGVGSDRVVATNMPVRPIITFAYQVAGYQLIGGPGWLTTERYDINAKMEAPPTSVIPFIPGSTTPNPMQLALRHLLEDRFKLRTHRETREMDIYALVMARPGGGPGPGLKPTTQDCSKAVEPQRPGAPPPGSPGQPFCGISGSPGRVKFGGLPASSFATALAGPAGRMVVDRTGMTGSWDFELTFAPENRGPDAPPADPNAPSFFTAIQEQLGLRLESTRGPVDVLVIDSVEKPVED